MTEKHYRVVTYTKPGDRRADPVTCTFSRTFRTKPNALAYAERQAPLATNVYELRKGLGWWSLRCPLPDAGGTIRQGRAGLPDDIKKDRQPWKK
jgi:hypothetical protein